MSVSLLLCEGIAHGPDVRLLRVILRGIPLEIVPSGGKDGFPSAVIAVRAQNPRICAFADNDFPRQPDSWTTANDAAEWRVNRENGDVMIGWRWRRKEIENYFIDPEVLASVLKWSGAEKADYTTKLEKLFDTLSHLTAGRMALTACAASRNRLETKLPFTTDAVQVKAELSQRAQKFNQSALVDEQKLLATFDKLLPHCSPGGKFRQAAIDSFAGKDILSRMAQASGLPDIVKNKTKLFDKVLDAMDKDRDSHTWLAEWQTVRNVVENWIPTP